jgi:diapolycopene oxygenase
MKEKNGKTVAVVGAGLGGMSAALSLAIAGYAVKIFDKNAHLGGKLNLLQEQGYTFDLGPSILTLPHIFERTFEAAGKSMSDYVQISPVRPHWRNFFEDGTVVDLLPEKEQMAAEARKVGEDPANVERFLEYSAKLYDLVDSGYFQQGLDTVRDFQKFYGMKKFLDFDLFRSMHQSVKRHFDSEYFIKIFDFFIKYVGSSAYQAPAFMNCLPTIQFRYDLWYIMGGMHGLADGLEKLMRELDIEINLNSEVVEITLDERGESARGLLLADGVSVAADYIVSNMEVIPAYRKLLPLDDSTVDRLESRFEPTCSGLVVDIGLDCKYEEVQHHNFFFSGDSKRHFEDVYKRKVIPHDPTLYVVVASRSDPSVAPAGCDCVKILPHIPHLTPERPAAMEEYSALRDRVIAKLERVAMPGLRDHIVFEQVWTPHDIERMYLSNRGSIYGVVNDRFRNLAFKAPKVSRYYRNLFFAGGSVNPGGGMPMVFLCGQNAARTLIAVDEGG